jgi:hypothetical protein
MRHIPRTHASLAAVFAAALLLTGCSAGGAADSGGSSAGEYDVEAPAVVEDGASLPDKAADTADRALVITGTITITADDPIAAAEKATAITTAAGGRVDARQQYAPSDGDAGRATLTLRIPADQLEPVRDQLAELGSVDETLTDSVDVGGQQRDLDTRISTLRASIARYTGWLADADTTSDLIELESAISQRQTELEQLEAQQRELADSVQMSTITLQLHSTAFAPPPEGPTDFWSALASGWASFVGFWAAVAVAVGIGLPWLVLVGIGIAVVVWIARRAGRTATPVAAPVAVSASPAPPAAPPAE